MKFQEIMNLLEEDFLDAQRVVEATRSLIGIVEITHQNYKKN